MVLYVLDVVVAFSAVVAGAVVLYVLDDVVAAAAVGAVGLPAVKVLHVCQQIFQIFEHCACTGE